MFIRCTYNNRNAKSVAEGTASEKIVKSSNGVSQLLEGGPRLARMAHD